MTITRTYILEEEDACKYNWTFTLKHSTQGWIIDDVQVVEREKPRGCFGHPKSIAVLLQGQILNIIHLERLAEASCGRSLLCGQALAQCLSDLNKELV